MNKLRLNQTELYNILVAEVENLKATKGEYAKLLGGIGEHLKRLEELYKKPIPVDTYAIDVARQNIQSTLDKGFYIPKWLVNTFLGLAVGFCLSVGLNYKQYLTNKEQREDIRQAVEYIEKLEAQIPDKPKIKK